MNAGNKWGAYAAGMLFLAARQKQHGRATNLSGVKCIRCLNATGLL